MELHLAGTLQGGNGDLFAGDTLHVGVERLRQSDGPRGNPRGGLSQDPT